MSGPIESCLCPLPVNGKSRAAASASEGKSVQINRASALETQQSGLCKESWVLCRGKAGEVVQVSELVGRKGRAEPQNAKPAPPQFSEEMDRW